MISDKVQRLLLTDKSKLVKPAEEVAVIGIDNRLNHALLLLTADQYSVVPVLDNQSKMRGLISMPCIMRAITDIEDVHFEKLSEIKVGDIMDTDYPVVTDEYVLENVLSMLVNHAFISVVDQEGTFKGIITRSEILKGTNRIAHELENHYELKEKQPQNN